MAAANGPAPKRFRRRLTVAFIFVAAVAGGLLAVTSFVIIWEYRHWTFERNARAQAELSLLSAPTDLTLARFDALLEEYRRRAGFETVAVAGDVVFSSTPTLGPDDVPAMLGEGLGSGELATGEARAEGIRYLVLAGTNGPVELYFFFPRLSVTEGLAGVKETLAVGWVIVVTVAALSGHLIARRTLRPVRSAAADARTRAERLLDTHFEPSVDDEVGAWAESYDRLADVLETKIGALHEAASRERRFTSDMAHELRTPLTAMLAAASLLEAESDTLPPSTRRPVRLLVDDTRRLQGLVLELLELARLDAGREATEVEPLAVGPALSAIVSSAGGQAPITVDVVPDDLSVLADRARLRRVVGNLVSNAVRHGGGDVVVRARPDGASVAIEVLDRGPGIEQHDLERIFDRFFKGDASRSSGGSGLGLAIAAENARLQGGTLTAENRPCGGARFTIRLPTPPGPSGESPPEPPPA